MLQQRLERMGQDLVRTVAQEDLPGCQPEAPGDGGLEGIAIGVRIEPQARCVAAQLLANGLEDRRRRGVGRFVGVELDEVGYLGLLARDIGGQAVNNGTPELAHLRTRKGARSTRIRSRCYHGRPSPNPRAKAPNCTP